MDDRGKRRAARNLLVHWCAVTVGCVAAAVFGDLAEHELDALVALHFAVSTFTSVFALGAYGLDAAAAQIIPAIRGDKT